MFDCEHVVQPIRIDPLVSSSPPLPSTGDPGGNGARPAGPLVVRAVRLRARQLLGKYRIERRLAESAFSSVYQAVDVIEGIRVALKIPHPHLMSQAVLEDFRNEVRLSAKLDHPNILTLKNAEFVDGRFVIVSMLGQGTLAQRLGSRLSVPRALHFAEQMLEAAAHAHRLRIIHCDIKPENFILFPGDRLRLTDFGIAKVVLRTVRASGSGTVGYIAPEQAMGKPSFRSDVFSLGLLLYRLFSGFLPEWPYDWPPPGLSRLRRRLHPDLVQLVLRAIEVNPRKRFQDAGHMLESFRRLKGRALKFLAAGGGRKRAPAPRRDWQEVRRAQFLRQYGHALGTRIACGHCQGPVSEAMQACAWCGADRSVHTDRSHFPTRCPRCQRGMKRDWTYCPWCYGPGVQEPGRRQYSDVRYQGRCSNPDCSRKLLMPFMRYCPWCRRKVRRKWKVEGMTERCPSCGWGVLGEFWSNCPWCSKPLPRP